VRRRRYQVRYARRSADRRLAPWRRYSNVTCDLTTWGGAERLEANARLERELFDGDAATSESLRARSVPASCPPCASGSSRRPTSGAVGVGKVPRRCYAHHFIEGEGLHSRLHLQNYYSTFWPDVDEPAVAHVSAFDADGTRLGTADVDLPRFGSLFLEASDSSTASAPTQARASWPSTSSRPPGCAAG
jgi:hypothetical protein